MTLEDMASKSPCLDFFFFFGGREGLLLCPERKKKKKKKRNRTSKGKTKGKGVRMRMVVRGSRFSDQNRRLDALYLYLDASAIPCPLAAYICSVSSCVDAGTPSRLLTACVAALLSTSMPVCKEAG
jgi:hypothetical protein